MCPALELAVDDDRERWALHSPHRKELRAEPAGRQRHEARERRAPDEVDVLAGLAGTGERLGEVDGIAEGILDLFLRERREAGAPDLVPVIDPLSPVSLGLTPSISSSASSPISSPSRSKSVAITTESASFACLRSALWTLFWIGSF